MRTLRNRYIALGTMLLLALCCLPSAKAQKTYQPMGSHVIYGDGSTDFYYEVTNPSTGQQTSFTVFFDSAIHEATIINAGVYAPVKITMTGPVPPSGGPVWVTSGGSTSLNGMTVTINPSSWTIARGYRGIEYVVNSSINVPLTVQ